MGIPSGDGEGEDRSCQGLFAIAVHCGREAPTISQWYLKSGVARKNGGDDH